MASSTNIYYQRNVFNIENMNCLFEQIYIRMVSEGSCDTEHWSNDAENSALYDKNKLHFKIYKDRKLFFYIVIIFQNNTVSLYF